MKGKRAIVFVSHDERAIEKFCERVILVDDGRIVEDGTPRATLSRYQKLLQ